MSDSAACDLCDAKGHVNLAPCVACRGTGRLDVSAQGQAEWEKWRKGVGK